ncbi:hypothetical protein Tco_1271977, partial [Tanacetum coccineum]
MELVALYCGSDFGPDIRLMDGRIVYLEPRDGVAAIKRRCHDIHGDGVRDPATVAGRGRLKVALEPSMWRWRQEHVKLEDLQRGF